MTTQTQMQHPYELFAYQVGQDMKALEDRVVTLENKPAPKVEIPKIEVPKMTVAVVAAYLNPRLRESDLEKVASGNYKQDNSHVKGVIQVDKKYAGYAYQFEDNARKFTGIVGIDGAIDILSQSVTPRHLQIWLYKAENATVEMYFDVKEAPKIQGIVLARVDEVYVEQEADGRIGYVKLKGTYDNGIPGERYLEYGRDQLKVTSFEVNTIGESQEDVVLDTAKGILFREVTDFMTEVDEANPYSQTAPQGYNFGIDEKKIRLDITTKEGFELSTEIENFSHVDHH